MPKGCIIYCIERGILEKHTLLSIASVMRFGGFLRQYDIFCVQPRAEFPVSKSTIKQLQQYGVCFIDKSLNRTHRYYSMLNKPLAINHIIENYEYEQYIFLDSDTLILKEPIKFLKSKKPCMLSPVYTKGIGIKDLKDRNGDYWQQLFDWTKTDVENLPTVKTVYEQEQIIAYWNAGIMAINAKIPALKTWENLILLLLNKKHYPSSGLFFIEQTALAATLISEKLMVDQLSLSHNFPLSQQIFQTGLYSKLDEICVMHHLNNLHLLNRISPNLISEEQKYWINQQMKTLKILHIGYREKWKLAYLQLQLKFKERISYFIYKFTGRKERSFP